MNDSEKSEDERDEIAMHPLDRSGMWRIVMHLNGTVLQHDLDRALQRARQSNPDL